MIQTEGYEIFAKVSENYRYLWNTEAVHNSIQIELLKENGTYPDFFLSVFLSYDEIIFLLV